MSDSMQLDELRAEVDRLKVGPGPGLTDWRGRWSTRERVPHMSAGLVPDSVPLARGAAARVTST